MRKIEDKMLAAVEGRKDWKQGNTRVEFTSSGVGGVFLYDNMIALLGSGPPYPHRHTFRTHPTRTTASRLRALGVDASIKGGVAYIDGEPA